MFKRVSRLPLMARAVIVLLLAMVSGPVRALAVANDAPAKPITIMPLGDSITQGSGGYSCYRFPLWEKLTADGYLVDYVGTRTGPSRIGPLKHEGYGGKTAEFLAANIESLYKANPADIVLLHAGHNHESQNKPVGQIITATASIIDTIRAIRADATILVAQVITSGKLPKYSYIPELNEALAQLVARRAKAGQRVILVNQANGFDWRADTVADHVHPNARGAEKMASRWHAALVGVLPRPKQTFHPELLTYKKVAGGELKLHVFQPASSGAGRPRPAIVFFFGGGWVSGTPLQFYRECAWLASRGMVAISADYRINSVNQSTPFDSVQDAKSAIRWVRQHAAELGVDPDRIAAAGASAGGHLAAAAGILPGLDDPRENQAVSSRANALLLWYAVIDNGPGGFGDATIKKRYTEFSPLHAIAPGVPPTLFFLGTQDKSIPVATAEGFKKRIEEVGGRCDLRLYPGCGHPIYAYRQGESPTSRKVLREADDFLVSLKYLEPQAP